MKHREQPRRAEWLRKPQSFLAAGMSDDAHRSAALNFKGNIGEECVTNLSPIHNVTGIGYIHMKSCKTLVVVLVYLS